MFEKHLMDDYVAQSPNLVYCIGNNCDLTFFIGENNISVNGTLP